MVNLYITYKLDGWPQGLNTNFTLGNCLFGAVKLIKNADPDKYKYGGYGIGYNLCSQLSWTDKNIGKKMSLFLELIIGILCILMVEIKIS